MAGVNDAPSIAEGGGRLSRLTGSWTRLRAFISDVWAELHKTTWPSRREVYGTTVVVVVAVLITAAYLYVVDKALEQGFQVVYRVFGR